MCLASSSESGAGVDRRTHQWVLELDATSGEVDEASGFCLREVGDIEPDRLCGLPQQLQVAAVAGGSQKQTAAGALAKRVLHAAR